MTTGPAAAEVTKHCYSRHPAPVAVIAAAIDGITHAMVCTSLNAVSLSPPIMSVAIRKQSVTWRSLRAAPTVGVSVLSDLQREIAFQIAASPPPDRLGNVPVTVAVDRSAVHVIGAALHYQCRLGGLCDVGDHWLVTLPVIAATSNDDANPMIFPPHYRTVVRR